MPSDSLKKTEGRGCRRLMGGSRQVDRLLEMKRQAKKFVRRRSQDHKREGRSLERVSSTSNKEKGTETPQDVPPDEDISGTEVSTGFCQTRRDIEADAGDVRHAWVALFDDPAQV